MSAKKIAAPGEVGRWICDACGYAEQPCELTDPKGLFRMEGVRVCPFGSDDAARWRKKGADE